MDPLHVLVAVFIIVLRIINAIRRPNSAPTAPTIDPHDPHAKLRRYPPRW